GCVVQNSACNLIARRGRCVFLLLSLPALVDGLGPVILQFFLDLLGFATEPLRKALAQPPTLQECRHVTFSLEDDTPIFPNRNVCLVHPPVNRCLDIELHVRSSPRSG